MSLLSLLAAGCATADPALETALFDAELAAAADDATADLLAPDGIAAARGVTELRVHSVERDDLGMVHTRVQQVHEGVPVWGGEAIVHADPAFASSTVTDALVEAVAVDVAPAYSATDAAERAIAATGLSWDRLTADPATALWVLRRDGADHLAWRVQLHAVPGDATDTAPVVFIDAHDGSAVWRFENLQSATCSGTTNAYGTVSLDCYTDGTSYYLENTTDKVATFSWNNTTTSLYYPSSTSTTFPSTRYLYTNAVEAQYTLQSSFNYFQDVHGRNGIDGAGGPGAITTHGYDYITATTSYSYNYVNAYWDSTYQFLVLGDGDGYYADGMTTLDIAGHELAHGVTEYEANLTYSGEPGHLNESFSDVFGAMIERSVLGESSDTWLMGEDTWTPATAGDGLRYMNDPAADGYSYDYYSSSLSSVDVHYGSGVPNLAFYLLSEGGTHPRGKSTTTVTAIGADDAADIWYLALTSYLTSSSDFSAARTATLSAASALYGSTSTQYTQVGNAWAAVGVGSAAASCTTSSYTGSLASKKGVQLPSSSGSAVTVTGQTVTMTGPSSANFDVYLLKKSGSTWSTVAKSVGSTSTEATSYTGTSGTYRVYVYAKSGSGTYNVSWCK